MKLKGLSPPTVVMIVGILTDIGALASSLAGVLPQKWANIAMAIASVVAAGAKIVSYISEQKAVAVAITSLSTLGAKASQPPVVVASPQHKRIVALTTVALVGIVVASLVIAGVSTTHIRTRAVHVEPVLPGGVAPPAQAVPPCTPGANSGFMGKCAPNRQVPQLVAPPANGSRTGTVTQGTTTTTITTSAALSRFTGPDVSNWDPIYAPNWAPVARYHPFSEEKATQGFWRDPTFTRGSLDARAAGLVTGGYDFATICITDPAADARFYVSVVRSTVGFGARTMPPTLDVESGAGSVSCERQWVATWVRVVVSLTHRTPLIYTGAWYWNPHLGCWWPGGYAWISGYGVTYPFMPCGRSQLDMWQYADNGFNGFSSTDMSVIRLNYTQITNAVPAKVTRAQRLREDRRHVHALYGKRKTLRRELLRDGCRVKRPSGACQRRLRAGDAVNREIRVLHGRGAF